MKIAKKIPIGKLGRRKNPKYTFSYRQWNKFPLDKMNIGDSVLATKIYDYGAALSLKNIVNTWRKKTNNMHIKFAVRHYKDTLRIWRVK